MLSPPRIGSGQLNTGLQHAVRLVAGRLVGATSRRSPRSAAPCAVLEDLGLRAQLGRRLGAVDPDVLSLVSPSGRSFPPRGGWQVVDRTRPVSSGWQRAVSRPFPECERYVNADRKPGVVPRGGLPSCPPMERQQDYVLRTVEERGVRLIRLWFTDVLGQLKSFAISPGRARGRLRRGHALRRLGHRRLQPRAGERRARPARPDQLRAAPVGRLRRHRRPACSATSRTSTARRSRATPARCCAATSTRPASEGFSFYAAPEMEFFYFADGDPSHAAAAARPGVVLRPHHRRRRVATCASARSTRSRRWASRSSTPTTRTRPASTRSTSATPTRSPWPTTS